MVVAALLGVLVKMVRPLLLDREYHEALGRF
jgi:hypothetical protein